MERRAKAEKEQETKTDNREASFRGKALRERGEGRCAREERVESGEESKSREEEVQRRRNRRPRWIIEKRASGDCRSRIPNVTTNNRKKYKNEE